MKKQQFFLTVLLAMCFMFITSPVMAQMNLAGTPSPIKKATVKPLFKADMVYCQIPLMKATLFGKEGYFIVDTGSPLSAFFEKGLEAIAAAGKDTKGQMLKHAISSGKQTLPNLWFNAKGLKKGFAKLSELGYFGIIGNNFLKKYDVRIDYIKHTWAFYKAGDLPLPKAETLNENHALLDSYVSRAQFPGLIEGHLYIKKCVINGVNKGNLQFDTGCQPSLVLYQQEGENTYKRGQEVDLEMQGFTWGKVKYIVPLIGQVRKQKAKESGIGLLGNYLLTDTISTIYFSRNKISIKRIPNLNRGRGLGIKVSKNLGIAVMGEGSIAQKMGLKLKDKILSINGVKPANVQLAKHALHFVNLNRPFIIKVIRDDKEVSVEYKNK